jgi:hypothetical protein
VVILFSMTDAASVHSSVTKQSTNSYCRCQKGSCWAESTAAGLGLLLLLLLLLQVPEGVTDDECILLGDILSTAFFCVEQGCVGSEDVVVVLGCGPVGLLAVLAARSKASVLPCYCCTAVLLLCGLLWQSSIISLLRPFQKQHFLAPVD